MSNFYSSKSVIHLEDKDGITNINLAYKDNQGNDFSTKVSGDNPDKVVAKAFKKFVGNIVKANKKIEDSKKVVEEKPKAKEAPTYEDLREVHELRKELEAMRKRVADIEHNFYNFTF